MSKPNSVKIRMFHGGNFDVVNAEVVYVGGKMKLIEEVKIENIDYDMLFYASRKLVAHDDIATLWYVLPSHNLSSGRGFMKNDDDIPKILEGIDKDGWLNLYVTIPPINEFFNSRGVLRTKTPLQPKPNPLHSNSLQPNINDPFNISPPIITTPKIEPTKKTMLRKSPRKSPRHLPKCTEDIVWTKINPLISFNNPPPQFDNPINNTIPQKSKLQTWKKSNVPLIVEKKKGKEVELDEVVKKGKGVREVVKKVKSVGEVVKKVNDVRVVQKDKSVGKVVKKAKEVGVIIKETEVVEEVVGKRDTKKAGGTNKNCQEVKKRKDNGKNVSKGKNESGDLRLKRKGKCVNNKGEEKTGSGNLEENDDLDSDYFEISDCSDSECSEVDIDFEVGEEDVEEDELFGDFNGCQILSVVDGSLNNGAKFEFTNDSDDDSDELRSVEGSDEETDNSPVFNPDTDFRKAINLVLGLKFGRSNTLRKALRHHSVEKRYDFYYLHSSNCRVTTYCRYKCTCKWGRWDKVKARIMDCRCTPEQLACRFKVHAAKLKGERTIQIKSMNLRHTCEFEMKSSKKVTSEYLADRFLEDWRENPYWRVKVFQKHVKRKLGFEVPYKRCWVARARAKLLIYGDGADQYLRVWDYVSAIRRYNPGSSSFVMVDEIERPPPLFQRMYICLKACKDGFLAGCRPLIGVDGCHLKGAYPGMCLVAVGKDGNNDIYPIAWAVVEVENRETWCWFLKLLVEDLNKDEGDGLTFMSDRQKGLVDAFSVVTPKADLRFCVRHIWANFKLQFPGQAYKDAFWKAARTTMQVDFEDAMDDIKLLNPDAHAYLAAIPPKYWSRHAFSTTCKSNMLLNNICESFNSVLKEARDKPILTLMEWIRRYVMRKRSEKKEGVHGLDESLMPYVAKYLKWAEEESRLCLLTNGSNDEYEVDYRGDTYIVDLESGKCGCKHWELTGIPCPHAVACMINRRRNPKNFVHEAYSKRRYMMAYEPSISAMPGIRHWPKVDQVQPLPPAFRKLPGRPNLKKRRKEAGEETSKQVKRARKSRTCSRCGQLGHNNRTCKNPRVVKETASAQTTFVRPKSTSEWSKKAREKEAKRKVEKEAYATAKRASTVVVSAPTAAQTRTPSTSFQTDVIQSSQASVNGGETMQQARKRLGFRP